MILQGKARHLRQRTKIRWLKIGDENTRYFQMIANGCKKRNSIHSLLHGDKMIMEETSILITISNHLLNQMRSTLVPPFNPYHILLQVPLDQHFFAGLETPFIVGDSHGYQELREL